MIRIRPTRCIWLVHIVKNRVEIIRNKWGRCEIWIHIWIERIVIVEFHFTNNHRQKRKSKQQTKRKEKIKTKPIEGLTDRGRAQKVYVLKSRFKVCVLWLPRYFRYSIEAKTSRIHKDGR